MKLFSSVVTIIFFFGWASAFSPLYDVLDDAESDLMEQVEQSTILLVEDVAAFKQKTLQVDAYNNLVCLGLGKVSVSVSDVTKLKGLLTQRITDRTEALRYAIELAVLDDSLDDLPVVQLHYFNLLDSDIDAFADLYQSYVNALGTDIRTTLADDEARFEELAASNDIMLKDLTTKRAYLATLRNDFSTFSDQLVLWKDFRTRQVDDVDLKDVVANQLTSTLNAYFSQQHKQLTTLYPDLPYLISDLGVFEDELRETLDNELNVFFDSYLGYYDFDDGDSLLADREEFMQAYYLDDGSMNCPVIAGGWQANLIDGIAADLATEKELFDATLTHFDGLVSNSESVTLLTQAIDAWYDTFFAEVVKGPYVTFKNKTLTQAQKNYQAEQEALTTVTLPYTKTQLLQALAAAANNYSSTATYHTLLETSLGTIQKQLSSDLSAYQRALFMLLRDAITEYLAQ